MNGLFRRGGVWWARLAVPQRLRAAAGRREFAQSTRTYHFEVAKLVASGMLAAWRRQLFSLESQAVDDHDLLKLIDGSPLLAGDGFLSLDEAATVSGLPMSALLRSVQARTLKLYYTVNRRNAAGYCISKYDLEPVDAELGVDTGFDSPDLHSARFQEAARRVDCNGATLALVDSSLCAVALLGGDDSVDQITLQAPAPQDQTNGSFPMKKSALFESTSCRCRGGNWSRCAGDLSARCLPSVSKLCGGQLRLNAKLRWRRPSRLRRAANGHRGSSRLASQRIAKTRTD